MEGRWGARDIRNLSEAMENLYNILYHIEYASPADVVQMIQGRRIEVPAIHQLKLHKLIYSSPGQGDWFGFGAIVDSLRLWVMDILQFRRGADLHKAQVRLANAEAAQKEQAWIHDRLINIDLFLGINVKLVELGYTSEQMKEVHDCILPDIKHIQSLADECKLLPPFD